MFFVAVISEPDRQSLVAIYRCNMEMNSGVQLPKGKKYKEWKCIFLLHVIWDFVSLTAVCARLLHAAYAALYEANHLLTHTHTHARTHTHCIVLNSAVNKVNKSHSYEARINLCTSRKCTLPCRLLHNVGETKFLNKIIYVNVSVSYTTNDC